MMIKDNQILELIVFIERLESTLPVPLETAKALKNQLQQHIAMMKADRFDDPLHKMNFSPDTTRERKQDFAANLKTSVMSFDRFIRIGEDPAHGHANGNVALDDNPIFALPVRPVLQTKGWPFNYVPRQNRDGQRHRKCGQDAHCRSIDPARR